MVFLQRQSNFFEKNVSKYFGPMSGGPSSQGEGSRQPENIGLRTWSELAHENMIDRQTGNRTPSCRDFPSPCLATFDMVQL